MSGNVTTPTVALAHYLWGNGVEGSINIANIGPKIPSMEINQIKDIIESGVAGTFPVSIGFTYATGDCNVITGTYLGNTTPKTEDTLAISANGSWTYSSVACSYDDKYDFNASTHRGIIGESLVRLGATFSGKGYQMLLPGEIHIKESGK